MISQICVFRNGHQRESVVVPFKLLTRRFSYAEGSKLPALPH